MLAKPIGHFVRIPTALLESFLRIGLTGTEWAIVMWVIRFTFGWNRDSTRFSWYRVAQTLKADRAAVYRAGRKLMSAGILIVRAQQLAIQTDSGRWNLSLFRKNPDSLLCSNATVAQRQRFGSLQATFRRRAIEDGKKK